MYSDREISIATKRALRGDRECIRRVLTFLWGFRDVPIARYTAYALVYQIAMNTIIDVSRECMECGGRCCREGPPLPIYDFDIEEIRERLGSEAFKHFVKVNDSYVLPRPCPFQNGWRCSIHSFKPYACLSYPFATEDEQLESMKRYSGVGIPDIYVPPTCIAGKKVKEIIDRIAYQLREKLGRDPTPLELLEEVSKQRKPSS